MVLPAKWSWHRSLRALLYQAVSFVAGTPSLGALSTGPTGGAKPSGVSRGLGPALTVGHGTGGLRRERDISPWARVWCGVPGRARIWAPGVWAHIPSFPSLPVRCTHSCLPVPGGKPRSSRYSVAVKHSLLSSGVGRGPLPRLTPHLPHSGLGLSRGF